MVHCNTMTKKPTDIERGERFRHLRETVLHISSQAEFAKELGVERGAVGNWELGYGVKTENLRKIAERYRISMDWLAYGTGERPMPGDVAPDRTYIPIEEMIAVSPSTAIDATFTREKYQPKTQGALPELDVGLGAGDGQVGEILALQIDGESYAGHKVVAEWLLPESFVKTEARASLKNTVVIPVTGDSMLPNYNYGDRVLVDLSQNTFLQDGVYAISDGQMEPRIKRLQYVFKSNPKRVRIISDNPIYSPEEHFLDDIKIIGRVCGVIAKR